MTQWGFGLLFIYVALGVSRLPWRRARLWMVLASAVVLTSVFAGYGALR
jgi:hypothetical protein